MPRIIIDDKYCKGCRLCVVFCPKGAIAMSPRLSARGVNPAEVVNEDACSACLNCVVMCPDAAIEILADEPEKVKR